MIDSGSATCFITRKAAKRMNFFIIPPACKQVSMADPSLTTTIVGEVVVDIALNGKLYVGQVVSVVRNLFVDLILGKDFLRKQKSVTFHFNGSEAPLNLSSVPDASSLEAMKVQPPPLFSSMSPQCKPIACKSRRYTSSDTNFIQQETERLLSEGIIELSVSPWRAQASVLANEKHKKRMVVDYSQTVNVYTEVDAYPLLWIDDMVSKISTYSVFSTVDLKSVYHQVPLRADDKPYTAFQSGGKLY